MRRWFLFTLVIFLGIALVMLYAWYINPPQPADSSPDTLRIDYKADFVLMVAEIYGQDKDLDQAIRRLSIFSDHELLELVNLGVHFAETNGYKSADLALMWNLRDDLQRLN